MFIYVGGGDRESSRGPTQPALIWTTTSKTNSTSYNRSHSTSVKNLYCFSSIYPLDLTVSRPDASTFGTLATVNKVLDTLSMPCHSCNVFSVAACLYIHYPRELSAHKSDSSKSIFLYCRYCGKGFTCDMDTANIYYDHR